MSDQIKIVNLQEDPFYNAVLLIKGGKIKEFNAEVARLRSEGYQRINLKSVDLTNVTIAGADFENADLDGASLLGAVIEKKGALFSKAKRAKFKGASIAGTDLRDVDLIEEELRGMIHIDENTRVEPLLESTLKKMLFERLEGQMLALAIEGGEKNIAQFNAQKEMLFKAARAAGLGLPILWSGNDFSGKDLQFVDFANVLVGGGCNFTNAQLDGATLEYGRTSDFTGASMKGARIVGASAMGGANFTGVNFSGGDCQEADEFTVDFTDGIAVGANFSNANLYNRSNGDSADLTRTDCSGANFTNSVVDKVQFKDANLTAAILHTDLRNARGLTIEQLETAAVIPLRRNFYPRYIVDDSRFGALFATAEARALAAGVIRGTEEIELSTKHTMDLGTEPPSAQSWGKRTSSRTPTTGRQV